MIRHRILPVLAMLTALFTLSCLGDKLVAPGDDLPAVLAVDRPTVQLFRFARGRQVVADTVRITNNGEGALGLVQRVGGVDYITPARVGWLRTTLLNVAEDEALLVLEPTYAEEEQEQADIAEVVLKAEGSPELKTVRVMARTLRGALFEFSVSPLTFAAVPGDSALGQSLTVRNGGNGSLAIRPPTIRYSAGSEGWLSLETQEPGQKTPEYQIQADPSGMGGGFYQAFLVFESLPGEETRAKPDSVSVQLNIGQPALSLSSPSLSFTGIRGGADPQVQSVVLANAGEGGFEALGVLDAGPVAYQAGAAGWLDLSVDGAFVKAFPRISGLETGQYMASFPVTSTGGGARTVQVELSVEAPVLTAGKSTVSFGSKEGNPEPPPPQRVSLSNTGAGTQVSLGQLSLGSPIPGVSWLTAELAPNEVVLTPTAAVLGLAAGDYSTLLPVRSVHGGSDTLSVTLSVSRGLDKPRLALSTDQVDFRGVAGDPSPGPQEIRISNSGGGILGTVTLGSITYVGPSGWLTATLVGDQVTLRATTGSLPGGSHVAGLPVFSTEGGADTVQVTFSVGAPVLTASATSASFGAREGGGNPPDQTVSFSNTGPGTLESLGGLSLGPVQYTGVGGWLSPSLSGVTLTLSVATGGLSAGTYQASVPVGSAFGGSVDLTVTFSVTRPPDLPDLVASPGAVRMDVVVGGVDPPAQDLFLSNGGGGSLGSLEVSGISYGAGASGWLAASLSGSTVTLSATTGTLAAGSYSATVNLGSANGGSEAVTVTCVVRAPVLTLSTASLAFSGQEGGVASPASASVTLSNTGAGDVSSLGAISLGSTTYTGTGGWLSASIGGGGTQVTLDATLGSLSAGTYSATVPVASEKGGDGSIAVAFTVAPAPAAPVLVVSSSNVAFFAEEGGADPGAQAVTVSNSGGGGVADLGSLSLGAISYAGPSGWLSASLVDRVVTLTSATGSLTAGTYSATLPVQSASGGSENLDVSFVVSGAGSATDLAVSPGGVRFDGVAGGTDPPDQEVLLYNAGGGNLGSRSVEGIAYSAGTGWLTASLSSSRLTLEVDLSGLSAGTYQASVEVGSASGGNEFVSVTLVVAGPALTLSSRNASFSAPEGGIASPSSVSVELSNTGAGAFSDLGTVSLGATIYGGSGGWLTGTLAGGSTRADLSSDLSALDPGTYTATVPVNSTNGGNSSISVTATVSRSADAPALALSSSSVGFTAVLGGTSPAVKEIQLSNAGGGTLGDLGTLGIGTISYGAGPSGWLSTSSLTAATLTLSPVTGSLVQGDYTATVPVNSQNGGSEDVTVSLAVGEPVLTASTLGLSFSGQPGGPAPASQSVTFSNTGMGGLADLGSVTVAAVSYSGGAPGWLLGPASGDHLSGGALEFRANQSSLPAGSYGATVLVSSQYGGSQSISVALSVVRETDPPRMVLSATELRFDALFGGADPEPQEVVASNAGGGTLGVIQLGSPTYAGGAVGWLTASLDQNTVTTRVATGALGKGTYTATLPVSSDGGTGSIAVSLVVGSSRLTVSPRAVSLGDTVGGPGPRPAMVGISNTGGGTFESLGGLALEPIQYRSGPAGWLSASLLTPDSLRLVATTGSLPNGSEPYQASVPVASSLGGVDTVLVSFTVTPGTSPPSLSLSVDSLSFTGIWGGPTPPVQRVEVFNSGGGDLGILTIAAIEYEGEPEGWLQGSVSGTAVSLEPLASGLPAGTRRATVTVQSTTGGNSSLHVALVLASPVLTLSTRAVTFSDTVASPDTLRAQVFVSNTGAGNRASLGLVTLGAVAYPQGGPEWLGTDPGPEDLVDGFVVGLAASANVLQEDTWLALVPVRSQWGGQDTIAVSFSAREPDRSFDLPTIEFVRDSLVDGSVVRIPLAGDSLTVGPLAADSAVRVGVRNGSKTRVTLSGLRVGIPTYADGQQGGWITGAFLSRTSATFDDPAELIVVLDPSGLPPGRYLGRLVISSESPGLEQVAPKILKVILTVN